MMIEAESMFSFCLNKKNSSTPLVRTRHPLVLLLGACWKFQKNQCVFVRMVGSLLGVCAFSELFGRLSPFHVLWWMLLALNDNNFAPKISNSWKALPLSAFWREIWIKRIFILALTTPT